MKVVDLLKENAVSLNCSVGSKEELYDKLIELQSNAGNLNNKEQYKADIFKRDDEGPTAIGDGVAIPHAKSDAVKTPGLAAVTVPDGIDLDALDGGMSNLIFMIAAPKQGRDTHLEVLSRLTVMLMDEDFRKKLLAAKSKKEFLNLINEKEIEKYGMESSDKTEEETQTDEKNGKTLKIVAVTACPTGIAHTFMAAEALEQAAKEMGVQIKVETNGSGGAKNVLTKKEIAEADGVIIAADKNVDMARFDGKLTVQTKVSDGIHKPKELIEKIISGSAGVYSHKGGTASNSDNDGRDGLGHSIYKHLMNGVSHMLPFVVGGGILIALAFLFDDYAIDPSNFGKNTPFAALLKTIGEQAFGFMLPILAGFIAMSIADRPGLAVGFVGGALAVAGTTFASLTNPDATAVSAGFLGALFAGFVGGYITLGLEKACSKLPDALEGIKPVLIYPLIGILLMGLVMFLFNPIIAGLNTLLNNGLRAMNGASKIVLGMVLGGMMSIDMGGPFNKAAYVFGTAAIAEGNYDIMAAVMVGGMVPPIAIALCTTFFKNRFTPNERKSGMVNYIMGLCFISEGAIPYAASDPLRVIPSCIVGSAVSGALSMAFGCTLMAPHGGIFVFPVVGNVLGYIVSLVAGSVVGMALLAILKKPRKTAE
ncbi:MAG: fructose-specific PTS transporter subunit EIIC [Clostridiales bacterium]|nr:fructose-specific PTS transporter subunit EIIC [Clostridiales bacterium]